MGLVTLWQVVSSPIRDQPHVSYIGRQIFKHVLNFGTDSKLLTDKNSHYHRPCRLRSLSVHSPTCTLSSPPHVLTIVICTSLCSKAYFLDWETGKMVSNPIDVRNPIKGTAMLDPQYPHLLYVGHGVAAERPWGCMTFDIKTAKRIQFFKEDSQAWRRWGAYDSSPLRVFPTSILRL